MTVSKYKVFFFIFFSLLLFLSFNKHSKDKAHSYHGVIWADAAGYYVYQPTWFIYGNNAANFPENVDVATGNGFTLDSVKNNIVTKYTCGVALLQSPFFLIAHFLAQPLGFPADGFSKIYSYALYVSGVFYCCFALLFLSKFLKNYFSTAIAIGAPLLLLVCTNLYYYTIDAPGMSHIYSFFLFSSIIYITPFLIHKSGFIHYFLFFACLTLIGLIRPTNILIGLFPLFYNISGKTDFLLRWNHLFKKKRFLFTSVLLCFIIVIPQLYYWYASTGKLISYSYGNERFIFWKTPKLLEVWFSSNNGLFVYTPLILFCLIGIIFLIKKNKWLAVYIFFIFLIVSYVCASWWNWWFGCSFGARSFIEYYALLLIPFSYFIQGCIKHKYCKCIFLFIISACCYLNMNIEYYYDGCFYGDTWDFDSYFKLLEL